MVRYALAVVKYRCVGDDGGYTQNNLCALHSYWLAGSVSIVHCSSALACVCSNIDENERMKTWHISMHIILDARCTRKTHLATGGAYCLLIVLTRKEVVWILAAFFIILKFTPTPQREIECKLFYKKKNILVLGKLVLITLIGYNMVCGHKHRYFTDFINMSRK